MHVLLGGGDQLYNDNVWMLDALQRWLKDKGRDRLTQEPSDETKTSITDFYVGSYLRYLHFHPAAELFRSTPQVQLSLLDVHQYRYSMQFRESVCGSCVFRQFGDSYECRAMPFKMAVVSFCYRLVHESVCQV